MEKIKNFFKKYAMIIVYAIVIILTLYLFVTYDKTESESLTPQEEINILLWENEKLWEDWRNLQSEIEIKNKAIEVLVNERNSLVTNKEKVENKIHYNRFKINEKIRLIENPTISLENSKEFLEEDIQKEDSSSWNSIILEAKAYEENNNAEIVF